MLGMKNKQLKITESDQNKNSKSMIIMFNSDNSNTFKEKQSKETSDENCKLNSTSK